MDNNEFQSIDENNNNFNKDEEEKEVDNSINAFVSGLPDWDLEPLYESIKRRGKE